MWICQRCAYFKFIPSTHTHAHTHAHMHTCTHTHTHTHTHTPFEDGHELTGLKVDIADFSDVTNGDINELTLNGDFTCRAGSSTQTCSWLSGLSWRQLPSWCVPTLLSLHGYSVVSGPQYPMTVCVCECACVGVGVC